MSTLDLVASLVALTVGLLLVVRVLLLRPRRVDPPIAAEPPRRTVADLVRMRAEQVVAATEEERSVTRRDAVEPVAEAPKPRGGTSPRTPAVSRPAVAPPDRAGAESAPAREVTSSGPGSAVAPWHRVAWMAVADQRAPAAVGPAAVLQSAGLVPFPSTSTGCVTEQAGAELALLPTDGGAVLSGSVRNEAGPVPDARVLLIQGGQLVDTAHCDGTGRYRLGDLAAGEYCLSATAPGHAPISVELQMPEGADLRHDVVLHPVADSGLAGAGAEDD